jgi:hypothetical protein
MVVLGAAEGRAEGLLEEGRLVMGAAVGLQEVGRSVGTEEVGWPEGAGVGQGVNTEFSTVHRVDANTLSARLDL